MRRHMRLLLRTLQLVHIAAAATFPPGAAQHRLHDDSETGRQDISFGLFSSLERMSRVVDITYCVGTTGVSKPFSCVSRCNEFPSLSLVTTWNTGVLMSDSCGYIAVDHGVRRPDAEDGDDLPGQRAIIVAFRGTYSITNTVVDLGTIPQEYVPYPSPDHGGNRPPEEPRHKCTNCTVHMGFLASWRAARKLVLPDLMALRQQYPDYPIQLVGHSLGGAVAMLAALELRVSLGWDNVVVTTFGEPKVGNKGLCEFVDAVFGLDDSQDPEQRTYRRVTHADDPVPLLPLSEWGFHSHAGEFFISKPDLSPDIKDVRICYGDHDENCIAGGDVAHQDKMLYLLQSHRQETGDDATEFTGTSLPGFPARLKLWQLFFAHRDYFWRLGLCVPGGDPANWGRDKYPVGGPLSDEL